MKTFLVGLGFVSVVGALLLAGWPVTHAEPASSPAPDSGKPLRLWSEEAKGYVTLPRVAKTDAEWKATLPALSYQVTREGGTERAYTGRYWDEHRKGLYRCVACGTDLYRAETKFESGTGWPSFFQPIAPENIETHVDRSLFMERIEVLCRRCGAHLGHVFSDGPEPTGLRYCMNSAALTFVPDAH